MTMLEWGALGELIGGIDIIVSLIYVALQIKQNTDTLKLSTIHNTAEDLADIYLVPAQNNELADIFFRGMQDLNTLDAIERLRLYSYYHKFFRTMENVHYQFSHGALEPGQFKGITNQFVFLISLPGGLVYWQERRRWYNDDFQTYLDAELAAYDRQHEEIKFAGTVNN